MKENELRIGNWVLYNGKEIQLTRQRFKLSVFTLGCDFIEPIPLAEEGLKRFGFEGTQFLIGKGNFTYHIENKTLAWFGVMIHNSLWNKVHLFQNLYFALTGQELIVK